MILDVEKQFFQDQILTFDPWPRGQPRFTNVSLFFWNFLKVFFNLKNINDTWFRIWGIGYFL